MRHKKELLKTCDKIMKLPAEQFSMNFFRRRTLCGTVGCIIGWHCELNPNIPLTIGESIGVLSLRFGRGRQCEYEGFDAIMAYFGISFEETYDLFYNDLPRAEAIARVRKFIAEQ